MAVRKGQFYMIGAILLSGIILAFVGLRGSVAVYNGSGGVTEHLFEQQMQELPRAAATMVEQNQTAAQVERGMKSYLSYMRYAERQHGIETQQYFLIGIPTADGYNATFGNFWREELDDVWIQLGDEAQQIDEIDDGRLSTLTFDTTANHIDVSINFSGESDSFRTSRKVFAFHHARSTSGSTVWEDTQFN